MFVFQPCWEPFTQIRFEAKRAPVPYFCVFIFPRPLPFSCSHCCNHWLWALHLSGGCCWLTLSKGVWSWRPLTKMLWFFGWLKSPSCGSLDLYRTCSLWEQRSFLYVGFDSFTLTHTPSLSCTHICMKYIRAVRKTCLKDKRADLCFLSG